MKINLKGVLTELGSNYETGGSEHSGAIIQCDGQNLHFDLPTGMVQDLAPSLFDVVDITLVFTPRFQREQKKRIKASRRSTGKHR